MQLHEIKVKLTWKKLKSLQQLPLLAEIHHQVTHVVAGFGLQREAKGRRHRHAADTRHTKTHKHTGWKQAQPIIQLNAEHVQEHTQR